MHLTIATSSTVIHDSIASFFSDFLITSSSLLMIEFSSHFLTYVCINDHTLPIKSANVVFLTDSSTESGKYVVVNSILVSSSDKSSNSLLIISSCCCCVRERTKSPFVISVTRRAALKLFFSKVIIVSID